MKKILVLTTLLSLCSLAYAQDKVFFDVFLVHADDTVKADFLKSLTVVFHGDGQKVVEAKRVKGNINTYEVPLERKLFFLIGFQNEKYGFSIRCLDNRKSQFNKETLHVYLSDIDVDYRQMKFFPPCVRQDDEE